MGDHRENSRDSRAYLGKPGGGFVPEERVIGRAFLVAWPFKHWGTVPRSETFK
jgi:signal peptidase I